MKALQYRFCLIFLFFGLVACHLPQEAIDKPKFFRGFKQQESKILKQGLKNLVEQLNSDELLVQLIIDDSFIQFLSDELVNRYYLANLPPRQPNNIRIISIEIKQKSQDGLCTLDITYPQIQGLVNLEVQEKINQHLEKIFLDPAVYESEYDLVPPFDAETCSHKIRNYRENPGSERIDNIVWSIERKLYVGTGYIIGLNSDSILSVRDDGYLSDFHPSVHPSKHRANATFDLKTGKIYECEDLFISNPSLETQLDRLKQENRYPYRGCVVFSIEEDRLVLTGIDDSYAGFRSVQEVLPIFLADIINPEGPLRVFLSNEQQQH